jgi:striatin 1/3/4
MLEYALKQERNKVYKLTHDGCGLAIKPPELDPVDSNTTTNILEAPSYPSLTNQKESRRILRDYLREVGFPDNVLEARVARLNLYRTLMNGSSNQPPSDISIQPSSIEQQQYSIKPHPPPPDINREAIPNGTDEVPSMKEENEIKKDKNDDQEVVQECFQFLKEQDSDEDDEEFETKELLKALDPNSESGLDIDTTSAMDDGEFVFGQSYAEKPSTDEEETEREFIHQVRLYEEHKRNKPRAASSSRPSKRQLQQYKNQIEDISDLSVMGLMGMPGSRQQEDMDVIISEGTAPLGELAKLTIANPPQYVMSPTSDTVRKWEHKYTMRSHFDAVTDVKFHPQEDVMFTSSEDCTIKLWTIPKATPNKRSAIVDVEPAYTFRGHSTGVLSIGVSPDGETLYSGSIDGQVRMWQIPTDVSDPFDVYDPDVQKGILEGHTDSVWSIVVNQSSGLIASCSADGTSILWDPINSSQIKCLTSEPSYGSPTCIDFVHSDQLVVVSYSTAKVLVYDVETGKSVVTLDSAIAYDGTCGTQINKVICHPTLPMIVTAHENKYICFFDSKSGALIHSMTAHMDAVTGLAIDPHGLYILSGSHDGSLRFWSVDNKTCVQDITAHRKRFDESIYNVACHLTKPYFASAGADSIAKVLV